MSFIPDRGIDSEAPTPSSALDMLIVQGRVSGHEVNIRPKRQVEKDTLIEAHGAPQKVRTILPHQY